MSTEVRRNERGAWCVYVRGNLISDHATHSAARIAAKQIERAESLAWRSGIGMAPDGNDRRPCTCGNPWVDSHLHRTDGPCFHVADVEW